jgi:signal transduction histidine kinase
LGLYITRQIVEVLGTIQVEGAPGEGAIFAVSYTRRE